MLNIQLFSLSTLLLSLVVCALNLSNETWRCLTMDVTAPTHPPPPPHRWKAPRPHANSGDWLQKSGFPHVLKEVRWTRPSSPPPFFHWNQLRAAHWFLCPQERGRRSLHQWGTMVCAPPKKKKEEEENKCEGVAGPAVSRSSLVTGKCHFPSRPFLSWLPFTPPFPRPQWLC